MDEIQQMGLTYREAALIERALCDFTDTWQRRTTDAMRESERTGCPCDEEAVQYYLGAFNKATELRKKFSALLEAGYEAEEQRLMSELFDEGV